MHVAFESLITDIILASPTAIMVMRCFTLRLTAGCSRHIPIHNYWAAAVCRAIRKLCCGAAAVAVCPRILAVLQTPSLRASRKILLHAPSGISVFCRNTSAVKRSVLFGSLSSINVFRVYPLDCKASKWFVHPMPLKNCSNVCSGSASAVHLLAACTAMHSCHSARIWHENPESNNSRNKCPVVCLRC